MGFQQVKIFEQSLKEERKNQFRKTLYWFALPSKKDPISVDITELYPNDPQFPNRWIKQLLDTTNPSAELRPMSRQAQTLKSIYFEHSSNSMKKVGFGYPTLIMKDTTGQQPFIAAPMFVWNINLEDISLEDNHWRIFRTPDLSVIPNELVIQHLEKQGIEIREQFESVVNNQQINSIQLQKLCNDIAIQLDFKTTVHPLSLKAFQTYDEMQRISESNGQILWSAVVGLFEMLPNNYLKSQISFETEENTIKTDDNFRKHNFSNLPLDPYQANIIRGFGEHQRIIVQGAIYTGLYDFVAGLSSNLLANGGKVLVISNHQEILQKAQNAINQQLNVENTAFALYDLQLQKEVFYSYLRQVSEQSQKHLPFDEEGYQLLLNVANRLQGKLDLMHDALNKPIFKGKKWIELIGEFLENHSIEGRQLLNSQLLATDYTYNNASYELLKTMILTGKELYQKVNTLRHPLEVLHADIFTKYNSTEAKAFTQFQIEQHSKAISDLYHAFVLQIEEYGQALQGLYETHHDALNFEAVDIQENATDNRQRFGDDFNKNNILKNFKLKFFALFSERFDNILKTKKDLLIRYQTLQNQYYHKRYFDYSFTDIKGSLTFDKITENLEDLKASLRNWKQDFPIIIHNEIQRLSVQTIHPDLNYKPQLDNLNERLQKTITALNKTALYQKDYETTESFVINNKVFLEKIMDHLESLSFNLRDFEAYYEWKAFWMNLSEANQKLLKAFITTKPDDWEKAYDSWFLHQILSQHQNEMIPNNDTIFNQYFENQAKLQSLIPKKIDNYWTHRRAVILRDLKRDDKMGYSTYFAKRIPPGLFDVPLTRMIDSYKDIAFNVIPVLCTTPIIAANYLDYNSYDTVIILEADDLTLEEGHHLLSLGKEAIICGSGRLKRKGKSETLMEFAKDNYPTYTLPFETEHKQLYSDFINRAYHRGELQRGIDVTPIDYHLSLRYVEGLYDENTLSNKEEMDEIIKILQELRTDETRYLPKVGIVCLTKAQRNYIRERLKHIQKHKIDGHKTIAHFLRNGLTVCALEDIVGKEFDVTILSTTFSSSSQIDVEFNFLGTPQGEYWIYHLLTASNSALIICSSLTHDFVEENRFTYTNTGLSLLCSLMDFINANQNDDRDRIAAILAGLHTTSTIKEEAEKLMTEQIRQNMQLQFKDHRVQDSIYFDLAKVDFWIKSVHENEPPIAGIIDSFFWRFPKGDYIWDKQLRQTVKEHGFQVHLIWSVDWWKYPEKTPQQLANYIKAYDEEFNLVDDEPVISRGIINTQEDDENIPLTDDTIVTARSVDKDLMEYDMPMSELTENEISENNVEISDDFFDLTNNKF